MTPIEDLRERLEGTDPELARGVLRMLDDDPERLRAYLRDLGYIEGGYVEGGRGEEDGLTPGEEALLTVMENLGSPKSTRDIIEMIEREREYEDIREEFESVKHRPWMNKKLNGLVERGEIGRYKDGRTVMYTRSPEDAIRAWARRNGRYVEELEAPEDIEEIADETRMPRGVVREALRNLESSSRRR